MYIALAFGAAILVVIAAVFFITKNSAKKAAPAPTQFDDQILTLNPDDIGLNLSIITSGKFANNGVEVRISKITDISSIDYQMEYIAKGDIPRGAIGHVDIKPTDTQFTQQLPFGTCSDKCHFDEDVKDVKITLKVIKKDGKAYSVEAPFNF